LIKIIIKEENFKWHLEAFASELFIYIYDYFCLVMAKWGFLNHWDLAAQRFITRSFIQHCSLVTPC